MTYTPPGTWMGSAVPADVGKDWLGIAGKYWRLGVLDGLRAASKSHDLSSMVFTWAPEEIRDRAQRAEARKS
jgi:hypothetical protein